MLKKLSRLLLISFSACLLLACAVRGVRMNPAILEGQRLFETGYYKSAMRQLMPPSIAGDPQAQYAVGYMYYYGYGVAQDIDMGYFWIKKSADSGFPPASAALNMITKDKTKEKSAERRYEVKSEKLKSKGVGPQV
jgi:TPR repeat protein